VRRGYGLPLSGLARRRGRTPVPQPGDSRPHNDDPKPFVWTATADDILAKVARGRVALQAVNQ